MTEPLYPFYCGSQMVDWQERNCYRCEKFNPDEFDGGCEIDEAIGIAYLNDGTVSPEIATRMAYFGHETAYTWDCPERRLRS